MAAHSSVLAWRTPWTEEPGGLQPLGSERVGTLSLSRTRTCHEAPVRTLQPLSWPCIPEKFPHRTKEDAGMAYAPGHCLRQWEVWTLGMENVGGTLQNFRRLSDLTHTWHRGQTLKSECSGKIEKEVCSTTQWM